MVDTRLRIIKNRLMKSNKILLNELFRIVNGALRLDIDKVRNYTLFLADKLENDGDKTSAHRLRKMLQDNDHQLRPADSRFANSIPVDSETRFPLIERVNLREIDNTPMIMNQSQWDIVNEFISVAKSHGEIMAHEAAESLSFLMYGLPGTGKSHLARFIARELDLELYVARLDGLISSFLGSTSKNIRALFEFAAKTPCVLFLDEFDAIAKIRGDTQELGELKRVVNSFLQNLDTLGKQSFIVAATNHESLLDAAVWRRFCYRLELTLPTKEMRKKMWKIFLPPISFSEREQSLLVDLSDGLSGSDIKDICLRLKRRLITTHSEPKLKDAFQILQNLSIGGTEAKSFLSELKDYDQGDIVHALRQRDMKLYSLNAIAGLLGISKATAHRLKDKEGESYG